MRLPAWQRAVPWVGGLLIAASVGAAIFQTWRSYEHTAAQSGRELAAHARILAEQSARTLQAVDIVLRNLVQQQRDGRLDRYDDRALHELLKDQALGLVQIEGLLVAGADGRMRAVSMGHPLAPDAPNMNQFRLFREIARGEPGQLLVGNAGISPVDNLPVFLFARRLETREGSFAGVAAARSRVDYFQSFYRDVQLEPGTRVTLLHRNGTVLAQFPATERLGRPSATFLRLGTPLWQPLSPRRVGADDNEPERFLALHTVPEYPLAVMVTRPADVALAGWRDQAIGTAVRTTLLASFAVLLLVLLMRQLRRLEVARQSVESAQERFALAVAGSDDGIWDWERPADRIYASPRARELLGLSALAPEEPSADWHAAMHVHPDDEARRQAALEDHLAGRTPAFEAEFRVHRGGEYRWVRMRGLCVRDPRGEALRMAGSVSDIDARKRAEQALLASDERYALAVAGSNQGVWDWDLRTERLFVSPRAQALLGAPPGEPLRPRTHWRSVFVHHPDDVARVRKALSAHLRGATPHYEAEFRMRHADGTWHWYWQRGVAVRDARGRPYRIAGSIEDVTDRRRADAERAQLEAQLRQAQKLEAIGTLAGGIAHDFNNILAAILGYGEMAQRDAPPDSRLRRSVDAVMNAGWRAKSLVERILAFSRSGLAERVPVHVQSVVAEALQLVESSLPHGVDLRRSLQAGDAAVLGDATQIHQVVMNLCANAVQATRSGSLTVVADTLALDAPRVVATSTLPPGPYVRISVEDTGSGIAPDVIERIFDPFFTTKEVGVGTGLGLSLVHGIVTDLGGGIAVESRAGEGSVFTVFLPRLPVDIVPPAGDAADAPAGSGQAVLLVDDEEALVRLGEEMLAALGYEPVGFTSSAAALEAFRASPARFDALLTDESMPGMAGTELVRAVLALRPGLPVVMMSGAVTPQLAARAKAAGVGQLLNKPLVSRDIARALAEALAPVQPA